MSERGVFAVDRGIWDHPAFQSDEPFSPREAWMWLISEAAWKAHRRTIGSLTIDLERGQVAASLRFLAEQWNWSKSSVERFLAQLRGDVRRRGRPKKSEKIDAKPETLIKTDTGTGILVITICNYSKYQRVSLPRGTVSGTDVGTLVGHERDKEEDKEYKKEDLVLFPVREKAPKSGADAGFLEFYSAYPRRQSKQDAIKAYAQVRRSGVSHETIMRGLEAAKRSDSRFREQRFTPLPASWLRAGGFEDDTNSATSHQSLERMLLA